MVTYQIYSTNIIDIDTTQDGISPQTAVECFIPFPVTILALYINFVIFETLSKFNYVLWNFYVPQYPSDCLTDFLGVLPKEARPMAFPTGMYSLGGVDSETRHLNTQ